MTASGLKNAEFFLEAQLLPWYKTFALLDFSNIQLLYLNSEKIHKTQHNYSSRDQSISL